MCEPVRRFIDELAWWASPRRDRPASRSGSGSAPARLRGCSVAAYLKLCPGTTRSSWSAVVINVGG